MCEDGVMNRGERIRLIEETASALSTMPSARFQLTLRTFGASTYDYEDNYNVSDEYSYCVERAESLSDADLRELHTYAVGEAGAPNSTKALIAKPWGNNPVAVFLSHRHEDAQFASGLRTQLMQYWGMDAFVAHSSLDGGKKWRDGIRAALAQCHYFVAILHDKFHESQWCDQEAGWAMGRNIPVMPVRLAAFSGHRRDGFLEEYQDVTLDLTKPEPERFLAQRILEAVLNEPRTHALGLDALAEAFVSSRNFAQTDVLWLLVKKWEADLEARHLRRLEYAVGNNDQIYRCYTDGASVPDHVKALIARLEPPVAAIRTPDPWAATIEEPPF
jgi:hypothetical protein